MRADCGKVVGKMHRSPDREDQQTRRSFVARLLSGTAGLWVAAAGVGVSLAGRAREALAGTGEQPPPDPLGRPKPKYGIRRPKYGVRRPRKYGVPPKRPKEKEPDKPDKDPHNVLYRYRQGDFVPFHSSIKVTFERLGNTSDFMKRYPGSPVNVSPKRGDDYRSVVYWYELPD